jgi:tripartite-type tricarboxylate transporter receptor subunit TctC
MNLHTLRRFACAALLALLSIPAIAQYPNKPIRMLVGFPAGGAADVGARTIATAMGQSLGQTIVIDNKPGANGLIATDAVAKAPPDGYTILFASSGAFGYLPAARKSLPYDPVADFTPIGRANTYGYFVYVRPSLPVRDLKEFISYAKANPGKLTHGSTSAVPLIVTSAFAQSQKLEILQVPYKGEAALMPDLLAGRVDFTVATGTLVSRVKDGQLRAIATLLPARSSQLPDVPTFSESGLVAPPTLAWTGIVGPAGMPSEVVQRLSRALNAALGQPEVRERFAAQAVEVTPSTPEQFAAMIKDHLAIWRREARAAGIEPE